MATTASASMPLNFVWRLLGRLGILLLFCLTANAFAAQATLTWDASLGPDLKGYRLYYGQTSGITSGQYASNVDVGLGNQTTAEAACTVATNGTVTCNKLNLQDGATYYFAVKAYNSAGTESIFSNEISKIAAPTATLSAGFSAGPATTGTAPLSVTFTDTSTGNVSITARSWSFGDNTTSTLQNPVKTYSTPGTYSVSLTVSGSGASNTATKTNLITVTAPSAPAPVANFSATPTSGTAPLLVTLTDTSTGTVASRTWDLGDGTTSTAQSVAKTYNSAGSYAVKLTVGNSAGSNTTSKTISVTATAPVASFSASSTSGPAPLAVTFTNASTGTVTDYIWNFGDGNTLTTQAKTNPANTYANAGTYAVSLTAKGPAGTDTKTQSITVTAPSASAGGLVAAYDFGEVSGATVVDASGKGNHGTITEATRTASGKFGRALSFDGVNDWVTVNDSAALDLTNGMTLEAWVYPTTISGNRTVLVKENAPGNSVYYLYANTADDSANTPLGGGVFAGQYQFAHGGSTLATNAWSHVAVTYDGKTEQLYINGNQVASKAQAGPMVVSGGNLRIGGNSMWGEFFKGRIDEVRIYNRALSATEIKTDMNTPVATSSPPTLLLGDQVTGSKTDTISKSVAKAFQKQATKTGKVTNLSVYVASGSTTLVAGLYANSNGRPGSLLAQGTLSSPKAGSWNTVALPATAVTAGTTYWIAILSPGGNLQISDKVSSGTQPSETGPATTNTTLPTTWWTTGTPSYDGPLAGYGAGY